MMWQSSSFSPSSSYMWAIAERMYKYEREKKTFQNVKWNNKFYFVYIFKIWFFALKICYTFFLNGEEIKIKVCAVFFVCFLYLNVFYFAKNWISCQTMNRRRNLSLKRRRPAERRAKSAKINAKIMKSELQKWHQVRSGECQFRMSLQKKQNVNRCLQFKS